MPSRHQRDWRSLMELSPHHQKLRPSLLVPLPCCSLSPCQPSPSETPTISRIHSAFPAILSFHICFLQATQFAEIVRDGKRRVRRPAVPVSFSRTCHSSGHFGVAAIVMITEGSLACLCSRHGLSMIDGKADVAILGAIPPDFITFDHRSESAAADRFNNVIGRRSSCVPYCRHEQYWRHFNPSHPC